MRGGSRKREYTVCAIASCSCRGRNERTVHLAKGNRPDFKRTFFSRESIPEEVWKVIPILPFDGIPKVESGMKLIRYAIRKADLHSLLQAIGVLKQTERLLAVNNLDLTDQTNDVVVVTVTAEPPHVNDQDLSKWTDQQIQNRFAELALLEDTATRELRLIVEEMNRLGELRKERELDEQEHVDVIPESIDRHIRDQLRSLLSGEDHGNQDGI